MKKLVADLPDLAALLIAGKHLPAWPWLKEAAEQWPAPKEINHRAAYVDEACAMRDAADDRWSGIQCEIAKSTDEQALPVLRMQELIAYAELCAGADRLGAVDPLKAHLREQRIDALASFLAGLAEPAAGAADVEIS